MNLLSVKEFVNLCSDESQEFGFWEENAGEEIFYGKSFYGDEIPYYILEYAVTSYTVQNNTMILNIVE